MRANELDSPAPLLEQPLDWRETALPEPAADQVLIEVVACGVWRSNLHMIEGEWADGGVPSISPIIPGHEVTGRIAAVGSEVLDLAAQGKIRTVTERFPMHEAQQALEALADGRLSSRAVLYNA